MTDKDSALESTLVLIKPDAVGRGLAGTILARLEAKGLLIRGVRSFVFSDELVHEHYADLVDRPFFPGLAEFMTSGMTIAVWVSGVDVVNVVRLLIGATNARAAAPGTVRGDLAASAQRNLIHASDSLDTARAELARFFPDGPTIPVDEAIVAAVYSPGEVA